MTGAGSTASGRPLRLSAGKTTVPLARPRAVWRGRLLARVVDVPAPVVSVAAPAGYGKTTFLAQWASDDARPFAWVTVDGRDDDEVLLLGYLVEALELAGVVESIEAADWQTRLATASARVFGELTAALHAAREPFVLVLDDVHRLRRQAALDVVELLARAIPEGSQLVLCGRTELKTVTARRRAAGEVADVRARDLALNVAQAQELLEAAGADVDAAAAEQLHARTEGWPAGLYLAALALRSGIDDDPPTAADADRFVEDFLRTEHIRRLSPARQAFLRRTAVLDRMSAELCDAVLGRTDSSRMLAEIEEANLFVTPLDRHRRWYRYHDLFREVLLHELDRAEPGASRELRARAGVWCEENGLLEEAIAYARAGGDTDRIAHLLVSLVFPFYRAGRLATLELWLDEVDEPETLRRNPRVAVLGAELHALAGHAFQAERWLDAAGRALRQAGADSGTETAAEAATVEALVCRRGVDRMEADALTGVAELDPFSPLRPLAIWLLAVAAMLHGRQREAEVRLAEAAEAAEAAGATFVGIVAAAQRALIALDRDDLATARELLAAAEARIGPEHTEYGPVALLHVAQARLQVRDGDRELARERLALAQRILPALTYATPHYTVQTLVETGRVCLALDDLGGARSAALDAGDVLVRRPALGVLERRVDALRREIERAAAREEQEPVGLSSAELRLLPLLTTHLTFPEIGQRLFLSPNTIKTQAISIYRKLGASSRREAVERAVELGLVDDVVGR